MCCAGALRPIMPAVETAPGGSPVTDLYEILEVSPRARAEVIAAAYRALARKFHPDAGGDERIMIDLNRAWEVLGDPGRRAAYDRTRRYVPMATYSVDVVPEDGARTQGSDAPATVIDFGRYEGWSIKELVDVDPDYLQWLARTPAGRRYTREIEFQLVQREAARQRAETTRRPHGLRPRRRFAFAGLR